MTELEQEIKKWEVLKENLKTQLGLTDDELNVKYEKTKGEIKASHPSIGEDEIVKRARVQLKGEYKRQRMSPAVYFEGMIVRDMGCVDVERGKRESAVAAYTENPEKAVKDGLTDENGTPLEMRAAWPDGRPNIQFGKPLSEHKWIRTLEGVAKTTKSEIKLFKLVLRDKKAEAFNYPTFELVSFRANIREDTPAGFTLNQSVMTEFVKINAVEGAKVDIYNNVLPFYKDHLVDLKDLRTFHDAHASDWNRMAVVQGDVLFVGEETSIGNIPMTIDDDTLDFESPGVTCWIPGHFNVDFGNGSRVVVVGSTRLTTNRERQEVVNINVQGLYAIPEWKVESSTSSVVTKVIEAE